MLSYSCLQSADAVNVCVQVQNDDFLKFPSSIELLTDKSPQNPGTGGWCWYGPANGEDDAASVSAETTRPPTVAACKSVRREHPASTTRLSAIRYRAMRIQPLWRVVRGKSDARNGGGRGSGRNRTKQRVSRRSHAAEVTGLLDYVAKIVDEDHNGKRQRGRQRPAEIGGQPTIHDKKTVAGWRQQRNQLLAEKSRWKT